MKELSHLNKYLFKHKHYLVLGLLFVIISNIFQIIPAQLVRQAFDLVLDSLSVHNNFDGTSLQEVFEQIIDKSILIYGVVILVMALLRGLFLFLVRQTLIVMSRHIEYDLKNDIYMHYQTLPLSFYRRNNTGDLLARISEDVSKVRMYLGPAIMYGLSLLTLFLILIPIMLSISVKLTLYALIPLPLLSLSIYFVNNIINRRSEEIQKSLSGLSTYVQEAFSGIRVIKSFAREDDSVRKFTKESNDYMYKALRLTRVNALFFPLIFGLIGLSVILTVYIGGAEVINGTLSFGNIAEFIIYINILTWPVTSLGWVTSVVQRAAASQKRINEFMLEENDIISVADRAKILEGSIVFDQISFIYPDTGIKALNDISFQVNRGETIAIIGTTGSGKTTIANLVCRMYDPTGGTILVDDVDIREFRLEDLRKQIGYVPQDVFLFSDTIRNNIAFGNQQVSEDQIIKASKDADLFNNIQDFPEKFETVIGERGITLSGGQKQRLSIARALIRNPQVLILDDCLSAVDTKTENIILENLKEIMPGKTSIIISHRVSSAKIADKIIVLHEGQMVESGDHDQLLKLNGVYKALYDKQLQVEELTG